MFYALLAARWGITGICTAATAVVGVLKLAADTAEVVQRVREKERTLRAPLPVPAVATPPTTAPEKEKG